MFLFNRSEFQIGDEVICVKAPCDNPKITPGFLGIVRAISDEDTHLAIGVEWSDDIDGHNLAGCMDKDLSRCGWWVSQKDIAHSSIV